MPKKTIKKLMPHPTRITQNRMIQKLGPMLQDPGIWHINRRSVSGAIAVGLFCAFIPFPFQMFIAALGAILFRVNILIAVPTVWVSNPVTIPPMFYFSYQVGVWILDTQGQDFNFELSFSWLANGLSLIWQPFLLGCLVVGSITAFIGYWIIRLLWRYQVAIQINNKRKKRKQKNLDA